jgi:hypothetical protein
MIIKQGLAQIQAIPRNKIRENQSHLSQSVFHQARGAYFCNKIRSVSKASPFINLTKYTPAG